MGKKRSRKKYTSKGKHSTIASSTLHHMRTAKTTADRLLDKIAAWKKGQNPWLTIENTNKSETNRPFYRIRANHYWGSPRPRQEDAVAS